jgi:hypothetical protein
MTLLGRRGDIRRSPGVTIRETLGNSPNTASFVVDGAAPVEGEPVQIVDSMDSDRLLFAGFAQSVSEVYEGQIDQLAFQVSAVDFTPKLNRKRPVASYADESATDVIIDLVAKFAPGFTTTHVQADLAKVTVSFDGTKDFTTCLSDVTTAARAKWKVDYVKDIHAFTAASAVIKPAVLPALNEPPPLTDYLTVVSVTTTPGFTYPAGYYLFRHTLVYADGTESDLQSCADLVHGDGDGEFYVTNLPLGDGTCVARRVYCSYLGAAGALLSTLQQFCQVNDNTTTEFTTLFGQVGSGDELAVPIALTVPVPYVPFASPYTAPITAPTAVAEQSAEGTGRAWAQFRTAYLYRDGSWSWASEPSASVGVSSNSDLPLTGFTLSDIITGPDVSSLDVLARFVYVCVGALVGTEATLFDEPDWLSENVVSGLFVVPGNVDTTLDVAWPLATLGPGNTPRLDIAPDSVVDLENDDPVGDLTDDNPDLLHADSGSQGFTVTRDVSQVRNRIFIVGASTTVAVDCPEGNPVQGRAVPPTTAEEAAVLGDQFSPYYIQIADGSFLPPTGGMVRMRDAKTLQVYSWFCRGVYDSVPSGRSWIANLVTGRDIIMAYETPAPSMVVAAGSVISRFFQYDDPDSQAYMAHIEPGTDGIYEYTIVDGSLITDTQLRARAMAEKEMYAWPIVTVRYATRDKRTAPGKTVHVNMTSPPCVGDFLIQDVQIDQIHDESDVLTPRYTVTASSMRMDLNDLLLALTKPQEKVVPYVPVLPQIFSVGVSALGTDYVKLTGVGFTQGTKVFFDGVESPDVVVE